MVIFGCAAMGFYMVERMKRRIVELEQVKKQLMFMEGGKRHFCAVRTENGGKLESILLFFANQYGEKKARGLSFHMDGRNQGNTENFAVKSK